MNTIFSRIKLYVAHLGISNNEFGRNIDCSSAQITQMLTYEKNFGIDKLLKIISKYPDLNSDWLLTGKGSMLRDNKKSELSAVGCTPSATPISPVEESIIYKMYKEKDAEVGALKEEIGAFKLKVSQLEASQSTSQDKRQSDEIALAFPSDSSGGSIKDSIHTRKPTAILGKSSAGKT